MQPCIPYIKANKKNAILDGSLLFELLIELGHQELISSCTKKCGLLHQ